MCAWLDDLELAIVAFDASVAGATLMVRRLTQIAVAELPPCARHVRREAGSV